MVTPDELPFSFTDGWPNPIPGSVVTLRETGIVLGSLLLDDPEWVALLSSPVFTMRVDDHPETDGWWTEYPDGSRSDLVGFEIPTSPVIAPPEALQHSRAFTEWVSDTHGALGRLLIWDEQRTWWMLNEPDLELVLICAPPGMFNEESDALSWLSFGTDEGRRDVEQLRQRYGFSWDEG